MSLGFLMACFLGFLIGLPVGAVITSLFITRGKPVI